MKIACVDSSASARLKLQQLLEEALASGRRTMGYIPIASFECRSPMEVILGPVPDVAFIGSEISEDHAEQVIAELREKRQTLPITMLRAADVLSVKLLRRFESLQVTILSLTEPHARILHMLIGFAHSHRTQPSSKLVLIAGAKGGVGTSTLTGALAHSAMEVGRRPLVVDLSRFSSLLHDLGVPRLHSSDHAALLGGSELPDEAALERLIAVAPNGLECLLPPAGSADTRERWLRDPRALEQSISLLELLLRQYDVLLIDHGHAEGLLAYALAARADSLLLVTSNDPASVYRTLHLFRELDELPRAARTFIALTLLSSNGLSAADAASFLGGHLLPTGGSRPSLFTVPYDRRASAWVGTGNTFYTEGASDTRRRLVAMVKPILHQAEEARKRNGLFGRNKNVPGSESDSASGALMRADDGAGWRSRILQFTTLSVRRPQIGEVAHIPYHPAPAPLGPSLSALRARTPSQTGEVAGGRFGSFPRSPQLTVKVNEGSPMQKGGASVVMRQRGAPGEAESHLRTIRTARGSGHKVATDHLRAGQSIDRSEGHCVDSSERHCVDGSEGHWGDRSYGHCADRRGGRVAWEGMQPDPFACAGEVDGAQGGELDLGYTPAEPCGLGEAHSGDVVIEQHGAEQSGRQPSSQTEGEPYRYGPDRNGAALLAPDLLRSRRGSSQPTLSGTSGEGFADELPRSERGRGALFPREQSVRGTITLEQLLTVAAAIVAASVVSESVLLKANDLARRISDDTVVEARAHDVAE